MPRSASSNRPDGSSASIHGFLDRFGACAALCLPKHFRNGTESPDLWAQIEAVTLPECDLTAPGMHDITASTCVGGLAAAVRVIRCPDPAAPVIIYHHGALEYDASFRRIFGRRPTIRAHLALVRAPFHAGILDYLQGAGSLARYTAMVAVSVRLIEEIVKQFRLSAPGRIHVAGISMGGLIALAHHSHYDSADVYLPMLAGPNSAHCLLESAYANLVDGRAKRQPDILSKLDLAPAYAQRPTDHVHPLLGRYDQVVMVEANRQAYGATQVEYIDRGHFTGSISPSLLRAHIAKHVT